MKPMPRIFFTATLVLGLAALSPAPAQDTPRLHCAPNMGLLQWTYGDVPHPPLPAPLVAYAPHTVPKPGGPPAYQPLPGGLPPIPAPWTLTSPSSVM